MTTRMKMSALIREVSARGLDPFPWYQQMRAAHPVFRDEHYHFWQLFRYQDVQAILANPTTFSSMRGDLAETGYDVLQQNNLLFSDPPRHRQLRTLISQAFSQHAIEQMIDSIRTIVEQLLDKVATEKQHVSQVHMDIIDDLAYPLPVMVMAQMLGVPAEERESFKRWSDMIVSPAVEEATSATLALSDYFRAQIVQHRQQPQDDMIGRLLTARVDDEVLSEADLINFCNLLMVAGNETTTNLIGNAMWCFDEYPAGWQQMRTEPKLIPSAIEEVLRFRSPVQRLGRVTRTDAEISGKQIHKGEPVFVWLGSANRDEEHFPHAEQFDIKRTPNRHLAFGQGVHFCLGAYLARLEARIVLETLTQRFQTVQCKREEPLQSTSSFFALGVEHLPMILR